MTKDEFLAMTEKGPVFLDGALGTNMYLAGMPRGVCTETWIMEHPEPLRKLQQAYAASGSQIIYAPTFSANRVLLKNFGLEDRIEEINRTGVRMTRENLAGSPVLVAGDLTTTGRAQSTGGDLSYEQLLDVYREQVQILVDAGVDLIGIETMISLEETTAALDAALQACDLPVFCTMTVSADGKAMFDGSAAEAVETLQSMGASAVGINCSAGPDQLESVVRSMKAVAEVPVIAKPNAGNPVIDDRGNAVYSMSAQEFADAMGKLMQAGAGVVGGCCGTTPEYIRALREKAAVC